MSLTQPQVYAAPFDALADRYDETFTHSKIGQAQRSSVWIELARAFRHGDSVLEIGCGTGVDACFLGKRGVRVLACDSSPEMITRTTRRVKQEQLEGLVEAQVLTAEEISSLSKHEPFNGAFSDFGALNCVQHLDRLAASLARLLRPGAKVLLCYMGKVCLWEMVSYLAQAKPGKAFRRFRRGGVTARFADGASVRVYYPSLGYIKGSFAPEFRLASIKGVGILVPPSYLETWARKFPRAFQSAMLGDSLLCRCPGIRLLGDHLLLEFERAQP